MGEIERLGREFGEAMVAKNADGNMSHVTDDPQIAGIMSQIINLDEAWEVYRPLLSDEGAAMVQRFREMLRAYLYSVMEGTEPTMSDERAAHDAYVVPGLLSMIGGAISLKEAQR